MAINQFIAHHSVIFQPEKQLMWVSTSPWQCGKYVAYDLNKIFKDTIDWQHEIYSSDLTIPEDKFIDTPEFQHLLTYKKLTPLLLKKIRKKVSSVFPAHVCEKEKDCYKKYALSPEIINIYCDGIEKLFSGEHIGEPNFHMVEN